MGRPNDSQNGDCGAAFWRFSLAFYARPGVAEALIALQDRAGCDVNLVLYALWLGVRRACRLDAERLAAAGAAIAPLSSGIVRPLRDLRRHLKPETSADVQDLRRRIAALELAAERCVQYRLASTAPEAMATGDGHAAAEANLALYLGPEANSREGGVLREALAGLVRRGQSPCQAARSVS